MFVFIRKMFFTAMAFFSFNPLNVDSLECVSMNNQECSKRTKIINVNNNEPVFYPFSIKVFSAFSVLCVPDVVKNIGVKLFNLMSFTNQTKHIEWHETCKCKCRLDASVCNNKQRWNKDKCRCECREELIDKESVTRDLFGILVIVIMNVINNVT